MIKLVVLILAFIWLLIPTTMGSTLVDIQLWPLADPSQFRLGNALFLFALGGLAVATLLALWDQFELKAANKRLRKELDAARAELTELRNVATMERDEE